MSKDDNLGAVLIYKRELERRFGNIFSIKNSPLEGYYLEGKRRLGKKKYKISVYGKGDNPIIRVKKVSLSNYFKRDA